MPTSPSPSSERLRHSQSSRNPFRAGPVFRGFLIHAFATACQVARPPVRIRPMHSAPEGFYFQASNGSVALPVAGYIYNSDWTPLLAGLSPAGMAASLAAPEPYVRLSRIRLPPRVCDGEAIAWPRMEDGRFREPVVHQLRHPFPCHPILLTAMPQRAPPEVGDVVQEHMQCSG